MNKKLVLVFAMLASFTANAQKKIENPILTGFNPDPSILRVEDDYYVATSTFFWFPGVQIHHSKDLKNWELLTHPLTRRSQLNMDGARTSEGVWAPCLSYSDDIFWLIYTNVKSWEGAGKFGTNNDTHNYLVTADNIEGPWSEPIYMNSSGFDPSLFHDEDGRKWFLNMLWDYRKGKERFSGVMLQEYSVEEKRLIGEPKNVWKGSGDFGTEAPHLYKHGEYYYLMVAEGGTEWWHKVIVSRSKNIEGPYETDPQGPCITSQHNPENYLQKAGHGSLVITQEGEPYVTHLVGRPINVDEDPKRRCTLGRETAIQKMTWTKDGWLRMADGSNLAKQFVDTPKGLKTHKFKKEKIKDEFNSDKLSINFNSPRLPITDKWATLTENKGKLTIKGRESLISHHDLSLIARRVKHFKSQTTTAVDFEPTNFQELAGLVAYYDEFCHYALTITSDEEKGKILRISENNKGKYDEFLDDVVAIPTDITIHLRASIDYDKLQYSYSLDGKKFINIGPILDATILSDDYNGLHFTGAFIGMFVGDYRMQSKKAEFDYFEYKEVK